MAPYEPRTPVRAPSLVDAVYAAIRTDILIGDLKAGVPLTENSLATRYDVARPTVKGAMERLVHEGLLNRSTNKSARVPVMDEASIRDLYRTRTMIEREVVRFLATHSLVPLGAEEILQSFWAAARKSNVPDIVRLDIEFHSALVGALQSTRLDRVYSLLIGEVRLCMAQVQTLHLLSPLVIASEHADILAYIREGNVDKVEDALSSHLGAACQILVQHLSQDGGKN